MRRRVENIRPHRARLGNAAKTPPAPADNSRFNWREGELVVGQPRSRPEPDRWVKAGLWARNDRCQWSVGDGREFGIVKMADEELRLIASFQDRLDPV